MTFVDLSYEDSVGVIATERPKEGDKQIKHPGIDAGGLCRNTRVTHKTELLEIDIPQTRNSKVEEQQEVEFSVFSESNDSIPEEKPMSEISEDESGLAKLNSTGSDESTSIQSKFTSHSPLSNQGT